MFLAWASPFKIDVIGRRDCASRQGAGCLFTDARNSNKMVAVYNPTDHTCLIRILNLKLSQRDPTNLLELARRRFFSVTNCL